MGGGRVGHRAAWILYTFGHEKGIVYKTAMEPGRERRPGGRNRFPDGGTCPGGFGS